MYFLTQFLKLFLKSGAIGRRQLNNLMKNRGGSPGVKLQATRENHSSRGGQQECCSLASLSSSHTPSTWCPACVMEAGPGAWHRQPWEAPVLLGEAEGEGRRLLEQPGAVLTTLGTSQEAVRLLGRISGSQTQFPWFPGAFTRSSSDS